MSLCGHIVLCFLICKVEIAAVRAQGGRGPVMCLPNFSPLSASSRVGLWPRATCTVLIHRLRNRVIEQRYLTILSTDRLSEDSPESTSEGNSLRRSHERKTDVTHHKWTTTSSHEDGPMGTVSPREKEILTPQSRGGEGSSCVFRSAWTDGWTGERTDRRIDRHRALCKSGA